MRGGDEERRKGGSMWEEDVIMTGLCFRLEVSWIWQVMYVFCIGRGRRPDAAGGCSGPVVSVD